MTMHKIVVYVYWSSCQVTLTGKFFGFWVITKQKLAEIMKWVEMKYDEQMWNEIRADMNWNEHTKNVEILIVYFNSLWQGMKMYKTSVQVLMFAF